MLEENPATPAGETLPVEAEERGPDLDPGNERSVMNLMSPALRERVMAAMEKMPELFRLDEKELYVALGKLRAQPTAIDNRLRLAFWNEYNRAQADFDKIVSARVYKGICTHQHFTDRYMIRPEKVAWLLCPPVKYEVALDEALSFGVEQLRDILALPITDKKGKINVALCSLKDRIVARLETRKHGLAVQKNLNINLNAPNDDDKKISEALLSNNMEEIQRRIRELEKRDRLSQPREVIADVEAIPVESTEIPT